MTHLKMPFMEKKPPFYSTKLTLHYLYHYNMIESANMEALGSLEVTW